MHQRIALGELADINPATPKGIDRNERVAFIPMASVSDTGLTSVREYRLVGQLDGGYSYFRSGDLLVAKITPCFENNKIALADIDTTHGFGSTEFHVIRPHIDTLDARYLLHFLRQDAVRENGARRMTGSAGQRRIPRQFMAELLIPLPALAEQRRIAAILDQADDLRRKRRLALEQLNALPQAVFQEMFGDPIANLKEWPLQRLGDIAERVTVGHVGTTSEFFCDNGIPFLRTGNVGEREIDLTELKYITEAFHETLEKSTVKSGDVLVSRVISDHVRCAIVPRELDGANCANVIIIRPGKGLSSDYIAELIRQKKSQVGFLGRQVGSAQTVINTGVFKQWTIPVPAREDQRIYSERMAEFRVLLLSQRASLGKLDQLFASLQYRAFSGEPFRSHSATAIAV